MLPERPVASLEYSPSQRPASAEVSEPATGTGGAGFFDEEQAASHDAARIARARSFTVRDMTSPLAFIFSHPMTSAPIRARPAWACRPGPGGRRGRGTRGGAARRPG